MVGSGHSSDRPPIDVEYDPQPRQRLLPVEVVERSSILARKSPRELALQQRVGFHLLIMCVSGHGTHVVDFEEMELTAGTCIRVYPGQVQRFVQTSDFEARMVVWPTTAHPADPGAPAWYPGSDAATRWDFEDDLFERFSSWVDELHHEQTRFDGTARRIELMKTLLHTLLLRIAIEFPESIPDTSRLPQPYTDFRAGIEERLHQRPTVVDLAGTLGYSSRTLDRACQQVSGQTAKQVLDERIALEIRRLLAHTDRPLTRIASDFGFFDPSNFSKFVKRHLGDLPGVIRASPDAANAHR